MFTFENLKADYAAHRHDMKVTEPNRASRIANEILLPHIDRFLAVQQRCNVPAIWIMPVFYREKPDFKTYFGNGDPLDKATVDVPRHRGPFDTWEAGVVDSLTLDHVNLCPEWSWDGMCWEWEKWNGFGPREHGRPPGYLWAGTSVYRGGKFIHDGPTGWSRGTWDKQMGCIPIAKALLALKPELTYGDIK